MRSTWQILTHSVAKIKIALFTVSLVVATLTPMLYSPTTTHADTNCGTAGVALSGASWLTSLGGAVNVCNHPGDGSNVCVPVTGAPASGYCTAGNVWSGTAWQCVELVNRLYLTRGWTTATWHGDGGGSNSISNTGNLPAGITAEGQGAISYINPGDVVSLDYTQDPAGHAGIFDHTSVSNGTTEFNIINQNAQLNSSMYMDSGSFSSKNAHFIMNAWLGYTIRAIVHHPQTDLRQFYVSNGSWTAFDISNATRVTIAGNPAVSSSAELARDSAGHLRQFYVSNGTWTAFDITSATGVSIAGDPIVDSSGGIWARDTNNHLRQFYVSNGSWTSFDVSSATGIAMAGNPAIGNGADWVRDANGHLYELYVSGGNWTAFNVSNAADVLIAGNPVLSSGGEWARGTNNHLYQFYVSGSWTAFDVSSATGINTAGDPAIGSVIWVQDSGQHLRELYVSGGWTNYDVSNATGVNIAGNPILDSSSNIWARDTNNDLQQFYQSGGSWAHANVSGAAGSITISSDPALGSGGEYAAS